MLEYMSNMYTNILLLSCVIVVHAHNSNLKICVLKKPDKFEYMYTILRTSAT